jgi:hypothetical protein
VAQAAAQAAKVVAGPEVEMEDAEMEQLCEVFGASKI